MATVSICLLFALHFLCSAIHQGHRRLVAAVNFGHKKTQPKLGLLSCQLSVAMQRRRQLFVLKPFPCQKVRRPVRLININIPHVID